MSSSTIELPDHLEERVRRHGDRPFTDGEFVLYWMRTAVRGHENPALDVALEMARQLGRPAFVYHALSERYPFASDRHHTFILEGARDVALELADRGIGHLFHLERPGQRGPHLIDLARRAALVVTEDMPVEPLRGWTKALQAKVQTPVWCVDTACIVPMRLVGKAYERTFAFRRATAALRRERLDRLWPEIAPWRPPFIPDDLPFEPVDLATASIPDLVALCAIDHGTGPVPETPGGSRAGYARWADFRDHRLKAYARRRNDALDHRAVSRMSPYLHYGQVSPFRIAREAARLEALKFLDELLVWREVAHVWCFYQGEHHSLAALPEWARTTLEAHAGDPRPATYSWETLARARTGQGLWDAAQRSLLIHGELHNNMRMTWGKALLDWTADPKRCRAMLVDLNHRYALDGRDPNSYGGLYWCLGLFDRPFAPDRPVSGTLRPRSLAHHAGRLDVGAYARSTGRAPVPDPPRVAVIGAGMAGLICARTLRDHGFEVKVFEKSRGPSGRMATRRGDYAFDHGAQYLTARDPRFRRYLLSWLEDGLIAPWRPTGRTKDDELFVGTPSMSAIGRHLAQDLDLRTRIRIESLERADRRWRLVGEDGAASEPFDRVVVATPAPQAVPLLKPAAALAAKAAATDVDPCWALMAAFDQRLEADDLLEGNGPVALAARQSCKPGRATGETWVIHGSAAWSKEHLEEVPDEVARALLRAFADLSGVDIAPAHLRAHRWRFARVTRPLGEDCLFDPALGIGACGDWCLGPRIECGFLSGMAMAGRLLGDAAARAREEATWPA